MIRIFLIAIAAGVIYYGIGIAALTALYRCGLIRRMAIRCPACRSRWRRRGDRADI